MAKVTRLSNSRENLTVPRMFLTGFLAFVISILFPMLAFATTIDQTIKLILPNNGSEYDLKGGSSFNLLTINSTDFTFEIGAGGSVELISYDKKNLSNDGSYSITCNSGDSRLAMSVPTGGATKTVIVTPSGSCSSASPSGGGSPSIGATSGGGGGGGGGVSTPAGTTSPTPAPAPVPATKSTAVLLPPSSALAPSIIPIPSIIPVKFIKDLALGNKNSDVMKLQALLASDKTLYPEGIVNGYFGPATLRAVKLFQAKYGLAQVGRVGPQTRAKLAEVFGKTETMPVPAPSPSPVPAPSESSIGVFAVFIKDLAFGNKNSDVMKLQALLASDKTLYPEGIVNGYFGPATLRAVKLFQAKYGLAQVGRVGPQTRAKLAEVFGKAETMPAPAVIPPPATTLPPPADAEEAAIKQLQDQLNALQEQLRALQSQ